MSLSVILNEKIPFFKRYTKKNEKWKKILKSTEKNEPTTKHMQQRDMVIMRDVIVSIIQKICTNETNISANVVNFNFCHSFSIKAMRLVVVCSG